MSSGGVYVNNTHRRGLKKQEYLRIHRGRCRDKYVHILIAEALLRRKLRDGEVVDHKDSDGLNPDPRNLRVLTDSAANTRARHGIEPSKDEIILDGEVVMEEVV